MGKIVLISIIAILSISFFAETLVIQKLREDFRKIEILNFVRSYKIIEDEELKIKKEGESPEIKIHEQKK